MVPFCFGLALLALAVFLHAAGADVLAVVCYGVGGAWVGYPLEAS